MSLNAIGIEIHDNVINNCKEIINFCNKYTWERSLVHQNNEEKKDNLRTSSSIFLPFLSYSNPEIIFNMNKTIWKLLNNYGIKWSFSFSNIENVSIQKYEIGEYYAAHCDDGPSVSRLVSAVLYLNTVHDGGRTIFPHFNLAVEALEGRVVIFPSNFIYMHEAESPKSNIKYAASYWAIH